MNSVSQGQDQGQDDVVDYRELQGVENNGDSDSSSHDISAIAGPSGVGSNKISRKRPRRGRNRNDVTNVIQSQPGEARRTRSSTRSTATNVNNFDISSKRHCSCQTQSSALSSLNQRQFGLDVDVYKELECPVCLESPRGDGHIFSCSNGHVLCGDCVDRVPRCPMCRDEVIKCRNLFAEVVLKDSLRFNKISCKFKMEGCDFTALLPNLKLHEECCGFKQVSCAKLIRQRNGSVCNWVGNFKDLGSHFREKECVLVNTLDPGRKRHYSILADGPLNSIFDNKDLTEWRPVLLNSKRHSYGELFPYFSAYRDRRGNWYLYVRAYVGPTKRDEWRVRISVRRPGSSDKTEAQGSNNIQGNGGKGGVSEWSYYGKMNGHGDTYEQVKAGCRYLWLNDDMVKKMCVGKRLFGYYIEFEEVTPEEQHSQQVPTITVTLDE